MPLSFPPKTGFWIAFRIWLVIVFIEGRTLRKTEGMKGRTVSHLQAVDLVALSLVA